MIPAKDKLAIGVELTDPFIRVSASRPSIMQPNPLAQGEVDKLSSLLTQLDENGYDLILHIPQESWNILHKNEANDLSKYMLWSNTDQLFKDGMYGMYKTDGEKVCCYIQDYYGGVAYTHPDCLPSYIAKKFSEVKIASSDLSSNITKGIDEIKESLLKLSSDFEGIGNRIKESASNLSSNFEHLESNYDLLLKDVWAA